jgi:hypothetical protein
MSSTEDISSVVISRAGNICTVIDASLILLLAAFALRIMNKDEIKLPKIEVSVSLTYIPYIMLALTIAHLYTCYSFNVKVDDIISAGNAEAAEKAFQKLSDEGPFFFQGLMPRLTIVETRAGPIFNMNAKDPTTWLAYGAALGAFIVLIVVQWREAGAMRRVSAVLLSGFIVISNWWIGGGWAVHASCLQNIDRCKLMGI